MKKILFITYSLASIVLAPAQTWTKISGIADTTTIEGIAEINNRLVICGRANVGNSVNFFSSSTGDDWTKLPTFSFPAYYIFGLPKNNIILGTGFLSSYKLLNNTWSTIFGANAFAEFPNGTIIGGQANYPDSIYTFAPTGTKGKSIGGFKFKFGPKYGVGNNGRVFLFSYGSGFGYIDQSDLSKLKFPATLNGTTMTETSWQSYIIADLEKTSDGTLFAVDRLGLAGIIKSTDNGVTWNSILSGIYAPSIAINSNDEIYVIIGNAEIRKSTDKGATFENINGNLPKNGRKAEIYINANNEVFAFLNTGGQIDKSLSGIFKLGGVVTNDEDKNKNIETDAFFPNPSKGTITIKKSGKLEITNSLGKLMITRFVDENETIDVSNLKSGIYYFNLDQSKTEKIIIE